MALASEATAFSWVGWRWAGSGAGTPQGRGGAVPGALAGGGAADAPPSGLQPAQAAPAAAGEPRPREAMKVKKGGGGAGTGAEPAPGASGLSVEPKPEPQLQAESESGSDSEPEAGPGPRPGPLQRRQPIGPEDVLGLQRITGGEHRRGSTARGREGAVATREAPAPAPFPILPLPLLPHRAPLAGVFYFLPSSLRSPCPPFP